MSASSSCTLECADEHITQLHLLAVHTVQAGTCTDCVTGNPNLPANESAIAGPEGSSDEVTRDCLHAEIFQLIEWPIVGWYVL